MRGDLIDIDAFAAQEFARILILIDARRLDADGSKSRLRELIGVVGFLKSARDAARPG